MPLPSDWAGSLYGTNTGNLFLQIKEDPDGNLVGVLRANDDRLGVTVYHVSGSFDGRELTMKGAPSQTPDDVIAGEIAAHGMLNARGALEGDWNSTIGSAGRFILFPHPRPKAEQHTPDQLHIARYDLGPIAVCKADIEEIAELIQKDFDNPVVVTTTGETEQSSYLRKFKELTFSDRFASIVKIRAQSPEPEGLTRVVQVEFGPQFNFVFAQSFDEAWARGKRDMLRQNLKRFETSYASLWKRFGIGINQAFIVALLIFLPGLGSNVDRALLVLGFVAIGQSLSFIDRRIRHASIRLSEEKPDLIERYGSTILSWSAGVIGSVLAGLLLAYLQGWFELAGR